MSELVTGAAGAGARAAHLLGRGDGGVIISGLSLGAGGAGGAAGVAATATAAIL